jgi:phospholipid/cholesterol/gamma-HCH transport system ATP-binding protein
MEKIRLEGVTKSFGEKQVLRGVNLSVYPGEVLCVVGKSGSGKSVILKHLIGFMEPDSGVITIDGERSDHVDKPARARIRSKLGVLFQGAALFDSMSVYDNIAFGPRRLGMSENDLAQRIKPLIERLLLSGFESRLPAELSGGMQKRVGLCRSLAMHPEIMLYDEPTTGVDPITGSAVDKMVTDMRDTLGITSVVITHDMRSVKRLADRVAMLYEGKIIFTGTRDQLFASDDPVIRQFVEGRAHGPISIQ